MERANLTKNITGVKKNVFTFDRTFPLKSVRMNFVIFNYSIWWLIDSHYFTDNKRIFSILNNNHIFVKITLHWKSIINTLLYTKGRLSETTKWNLSEKRQNKMKGKCHSNENADEKWSNIFLSIWDKFD